MHKPNTPWYIFFFKDSRSVNKLSVYNRKKKI